MSQLDVEKAQQLEKKYDTALQVRAVGPWVGRFVFVFSIVFAFYHYITAGVRVPVDHWHMGIHLSGVLLLVFIGYPALARPAARTPHPLSWWRYGNVPVYDWLFALVGILTALYVGLTWHGIDTELFGIKLLLGDRSLRQGDPAVLDIVAGTLLILVLLEAVRRTLGPAVPIIIVLFTAYALFGEVVPIDTLKHPGIDWAQYVDKMYFPQDGVFGVTLWVVSTVVFHFVLFGVLAQRMGLGQFFVDVATVVAGRHTGGLAKVSVVSSAFFGTISGSSVANTVWTGSLTIPNMKRNGYPGHLAGGIEAAASAGGQITPPIMGAAALIMAEFLEVPYTTIVIAAIVPAAMYYVGVLSIVHFEAKRLGLGGMSRQQVPRLRRVLKVGWPTAVPLVVLVYVLFSGRSPHMAAFWGITTAIAVGFLNPRHRITFSDLYDGCALGVRYALAVSAVCAAIGIVVGVVNTTDLGVRLGVLVTDGAQIIAEVFHPAVALIPLTDFSVPDITLFVSLVLIAITCILLGAGLPTTALYIMLAAVAQPALAALGVPPLASHLFVLYYGVISEITPPVCTSAYVAAGIAGAKPIRTGVSAFSLGIAKLMVPMVFVYAPAMLIVLDAHFTWTDFLSTTLTCAFGVLMVATGVAGHFIGRMPLVLRALVIFAGILMVAPGLKSDLWALAFAAPVLLQQTWAVRRARRPQPARG